MLCKECHNGGNESNIQCRCNPFKHYETIEYRRCEGLKYHRYNKELLPHKEGYNDFVDEYLSLCNVIESFEVNHYRNIGFDFDMCLNIPINYEGIDVLYILKMVKQYFKHVYINQYIQTLDNRPENIDIVKFIKFLDKKYIHRDINFYSNNYVGFTCEVPKVKNRNRKRY